MEDNGVKFDDYDHFLKDDPVIDPQEEGDLNTHDPDMWLYQMNNKYIIAFILIIHRNMFNIKFILTQLSGDLNALKIVVYCRD